MMLMRKKQALLITSKLELSNFKDAVKLICFDDKSVMHNAETLEALQKIHPTDAADQTHPKPSHMNHFKLHVLPCAKS